MYRISKEFSFSSSHVLDGLAEGHQCGRVHGHNYVVTLTLVSDSLDATGFVVDYGDLAPFKEYLDRSYDHRHLNDVVAFQPSAENLARHLYGFASTLPFGTAVESVTVQETAKTTATYSAK